MPDDSEKAGGKIIIDAHVHLGKSFGSYESYIFETPDGLREYFSPDRFIGLAIIKSIR